VFGAPRDVQAHPKHAEEHRDSHSDSAICWISWTSDPCNEGADPKFRRLGRSRVTPDAVDPCGVGRLEQGCPRRPSHFDERKVRTRANAARSSTPARTFPASCFSTSTIFLLSRRISLMQSRISGPTTTARRTSRSRTP